MNSTERFSSRVDNYTKYRPSYPSQVLDLLQTECNLTPDSIVADIGSGTGIFTYLLLDRGCTVYAVEPNKEMRKEAERQLAHLPNFRSVSATAENTTLPKHSVDLITASQAFHWFDPEAAKREFARILKPGGWVALIWNYRNQNTTPFLTDYEHLISTYSLEYGSTKHTSRSSQEHIDALFAPNPHKEATFENSQRFDYEGLKGRLLSSSYTPQPDHPNYEPMLANLQSLFTQYQQRGYVSLEYTTRVFYGQLRA